MGLVSRTGRNRTVRAIVLLKTVTLAMSRSSARS
jgi:hypothetical protein